MLEKNAPTTLPKFTSVPCEQYHSRIFNHVFSQVLEKVFLTLETRPFDGVYPDVLPCAGRIPFGLSSSKFGMNQDQFIYLIDKVVEERFIQNQDYYLRESLPVPLDPVGLIADILGTVTSSPPLNYLLAPIPTLMEKEVFRGLVKLLDYPDGKGDGIFLPGAGFAHICVINLAIHKAYPGVKELGIKKGLNGQKPCVFVSERNYLEIKKACILNGMDKNSCIPVAVNINTSTMDIYALQNAINLAVLEGLSPFLVVATLGSQDLLYIDSLTDIQRVCSKFKMWLHVDGSVGGPLIFCRTWRDSALKGIEYSDSFTLGIETLLGSPPCSVCLVTKYGNLCNNAFDPRNQVFSRESKLYDTSYDRGINTPLTSRRADVLKLWLMWKFYGTTGLGTKVDCNVKAKLQLGISKQGAQIPRISGEIFTQALETIKNNSLYFEKSAETPIHFVRPEELENIFDFALQDLPLDNTWEEFQKILIGVLKFSNKIPHPKYLFHLGSAGLDPYGIVGDILASVTCGAMDGCSGITQYHMEQQIFAATRKLVGYSPSESTEERSVGIKSEGNGLICAGATCAVMAAMFSAKSIKFPDGNQKENPLKIFVSENAHSCFQKAAIILGFGLNSVVSVKVDDNGKMSVPSLREAVIKSLKENEVPFFVGVTAGTTVQGVFDPIFEIAEACEDFGLWMHVDGSWGGSAIFSPKFKEMYMNSLHLANSFSFNPPKWLALPTVCSVLLFRDQNIIHKAFGQFVGQSESSSDVELYSGVQAGRRNNVLKFWMTWKAKGLEGFRNHIEYSYALKDFLVSEMSRPERRHAFRLWRNDFETPAVLFQYIPKSLRHFEDFEAEDLQRKLGEAAEIINDKLIKDCSFMIGMHNDGTSQHLLRIIVMSSGVTNDEILSMLNDIDKIGENILL